MRRDGQPASADVIASMSAAIAHRGVDASGVACDGPVGMAHRLSWSTAESRHERQTGARAIPRSHIVADARIDNRSDLSETLRIAEPSQVSDAEVIVRAYERWGARCVEHLLGDFAFAIWDSRSRELFCARDPMGVKPFYYFESRDLFAFGSEARALFAVPEVPRAIDPLRIASFIDGTICERTHTHYKSIRRLPAAHTLTVSAATSSQSQYWRPDPERELRLSSSGEYAEAFLEIFTDAVKVRAHSVHPVGASLSGGLDSSSITCVARQLRRADGSSALHTFSLVFPSLPERDLRLIDERKYIESVVRGGGIVQNWVRGDEVSPTLGIDEILKHLDEPFAAPNLYLHCAMYRAAKASGARVFLDGFDGDTTVSHGFGRFNGLIDRREWDVFEREVRALAHRRGVRPESLLSHFGLPHLSHLARRGRWCDWGRIARQLTHRFDVPFGRTAIAHGVKPAAPALHGAYRAMRGVRDEATSLLRAEIAQALRDHDQPEAADDEATWSERRSHVQALSLPAYQLTLEMADQCAAAFGIEPRYPFFDRRLIEFCLAVPDSEKLADGWPRLVFRRAMEGILPEEIRWRIDKGNLSPNFHRLLRAAQTVAPPMTAQSPLAAYVDPEAVGKMRRGYCAEKTTLGRSTDGHTLFRLSVLERWLESKDAQARDSARPRSPIETLAVA